MNAEDKEKIRELILELVEQRDCKLYITEYKHLKKYHELTDKYTDLDAMKALQRYNESVIRVIKLVQTIKED